MRTRITITLLCAIVISMLSAAPALACPPPDIQFVGGMTGSPKWWTSWTWFYHFGAEGWAKRNGDVVVTENSAFAWVPTPIGAYATPAQGLTYAAKWWESGTKSVNVVVMYTYQGYLYTSGASETHTF